MRDYELMVIFHPELDASGITAGLDALKARITQAGDLTQCDVLGRRRLAYEVRRCTQGTFALLNFTVPAETVAELRRYMHIELRDQVIRHLLLLDEKRGSRPPAQPLPGEPEEHASSEEQLAQAAAERAALEAEVVATTEAPAPVAAEPAAEAEAEAEAAAEAPAEAPAAEPE